jgi:hypothetical protein
VTSLQPTGVNEARRTADAGPIVSRYDYAQDVAGPFIDDAERHMEAPGCRPWGILSSRGLGEKFH